MGIGTGSGDDRAEQAAANAVENPLLEDNSIAGAKHILVSISGNEDISLLEYDAVMNYIAKNADPNVHIIIGQTIDAALGDKLQVTVIATGFKNDTIKMPEQETAKTGKGDCMDYGEFRKITDRSKGVPESFSPGVFRDDDIEVPTLLRDRKYRQDRDAEKFGSSGKDG
jgi:cell division protein FtsZ